MESYPTTLAAGATRTVQLPFRAVCALVNNPTQQWLSFPDNPVDGFVAPGGQEVLVSLPRLDSVQLQWAAPTNVTQPAGVAGQQASIRLFDTQIPYSGYPTQQSVSIVGNVTATVTGNVSVTGGTIDATIQNASLAVTNLIGTVLATAQQSKQLGNSINSVPGGTMDTGSLNLDPAAQGLVVAIQTSDANAGCFSNLRITDGSLSHTFLQIAPSLPTVLIACPLPPFNGTVRVKLDESGLCGVASVVLWEVLQGMEALLEVTPLPQQFPNQAPLKFEGTVANGGFATIIAAVAGVAIAPFHINLSIAASTLTLGSGGSTGVLVALDDPGGSGFNWWKGIRWVPAYTSNTGASDGDRDIPMGGAEGPRGAGIRIANPNTQSLGYYGELEYSLT